MVLGTNSKKIHTDKTIRSNHLKEELLNKFCLNLLKQIRSLGTNGPLLIGTAKTATRLLQTKELNLSK